MPAITAFNPDDDFRDKDTNELRAELARALKLTADHLLYLSRVWAELERRGEDLTALRSGIAIYLPAIAAGTARAEAVVAFAGQPALLRKVLQLPPVDQQRFAAGEPVKVVEKGDKGFTHRMLPLSILPPSAIRQVFGERHIRTEAEQIAILSVPPKPPKPMKPITRGLVTADPVHDTIQIGRSKVVAPISDVIEALRALGKI